MTQLASTIISEFGEKVDINNTLFIILGEGKTCSVSRALFDYERRRGVFLDERRLDKNKELYWVSIDPIFDNWSGSNHPKKIKTSLLGQKAENINLDEILTLYDLLYDIDEVVLISLNAHTHAGKFLDRLIISTSKIFGKIKIYGLCSKCHNPGLYKRQIKYTLKYPKNRRTHPEKHKGWLLDVDVSTNL